MHQQLEERVQRLEKSDIALQRRLDDSRDRGRRVAVAATLAIVLLGVAGAAALNGSSFQLFHPVTNTQRIKFGWNSEGKTAGLIFNDDNATERVFVGTSEENRATIQMFAADGKTVTLAAGNSDGELPFFQLFTPKRKLRIAAGISP